MRPPFQVIDSDGHINEPEEIIATYMPPPYDAYLHAWKANTDGVVYSNNTLVPKQPGMDPTMGGTLGTNGPPGFPFPSDWLAIMDEAGVEKTYLYPTAFLPYSMMADPEYTVAVTRAYNSFIHDHWLQVDDRFGAVAVMPLIDAGESAKELRRSVTELGFAGAFTPAVGYGLIGRKQNHPFFAEAQDLDTTVAIHGGHATAEYIPYTRFIQRHAVGFPVSQIIQMTSLALEGIFELFPNLRVAFLEAGCTWVPYMLDRLDEEWELRGKVEAPNCKHPPSEYLRGSNVFVHLEPDEKLLPQTLEILGDDALVYASDWPHWDNDFPNSIDHIWEREDITESQKGAILRDNPLAMYGITDSEGGA